MTIGIAVAGQRAGLGILAALKQAEKAGSGAIGGFVSVAMLDDLGVLHRYTTQNGGCAALTDENGNAPAESTLVAARKAALISSGPNRPEPLSQFIMAGNGCLVTGHRFPNARPIPEKPISQLALDRLLAHEDAATAIESTLESFPEIDAGLIGIDSEGRVAAANSARVARRPDQGQCQQEEGGNIVSILHNAIYPVAGYAQMLSRVALDVMQEECAPASTFHVTAGIVVERGSRNRILLSDDGHYAERILITDLSLLTGLRHGAPIYLGAEVHCGGRYLGEVMTEPYVVLENGRICSLDGKVSVQVSLGLSRSTGGGAG